MYIEFISDLQEVWLTILVYKLSQLSLDSAMKRAQCAHLFWFKLFYVLK